MIKNIKEKDLEKVVLKGLEYEIVEKEKAAERKALTRKNGLNPEDAQYIQNQTGQTRDIIAKMLSMSGRQWERMKFIYQHRDCLSEEEYEKWRIGNLSTSKIYTLLNNKLRNNTVLDEMINVLDKMLWADIQYEKSFFHTEIYYELQSALFSCEDNAKDKVKKCFDKFKQYHLDYLNEHFKEISEMKTNLIELKQKLKTNMHKDI